MIIHRLEAALAEELARWSRERGLDAPGSLALAAPPAHVAADLSTGWPLQAAKKLKKAPVQIAGELAEALKAPMSALADTGFAAPGFLNLTFAPQALKENLLAILAEPGKYGRLAKKPGGRTLIEFVSANPTGPLHMASGRAATMGDALVRILRRLGHDADAEYYVNDEGRQVRLLGLTLKARWQQKKGLEVPLPENGYAGEYLAEMAAGLGPQADGWTDEQFSRHAVELLLETHRRDMDDFHVEFDRWFRESELHRAKSLDETLEFLRSKELVFEKDGAVWLATGGGEDDKDRVLVRADGQPTYFLADIAYHLHKLRRGYTRLIDIWGADHHGYVPRMKAAVEALDPEAEFEPIVHQLVHLFRGTEAVRMSKRAGQFVTLRELMEEVGVDACRFFFAMRTPNSHLNFDLELAKKKSQDNPVFYVQYVHARIRSIFGEAEKRGLPVTGPAVADGELGEPESRALLVKLAWFPEVLKACAREKTPHHLTTYLTELAGLFHPFYEKHRVADETAPVRTSARLALCEGVRQVIGEGLGLLGVGAPERM